MRSPNANTPARAAAISVEDAIRRDTKETGVLIGPDGAILVRRSGQANSVELTVEELRRAKGATFTHNHPNGSGPSLSDVRIAALYSMKEMRVVTAEFRHGVGMLKPRHLPNLNEGHLADEESGAERAVRVDVMRGIVHVRDYGIEVRHRAWLRLANRFGFDYWRQQ